MKKYIASLLTLALLSFALVSTVKAQSGQNTVYQLNPDGLAQISGTANARILQPTFSATMSVNPNLGIYHKFLGVNTTSATSTVSAAGPGQFGQMLVTQCAADASGTVTYTFSTNFLPTATVAATASKSITVLWFSDGIAWHECARSASAQ